MNSPHCIDRKDNLFTIRYYNSYNSIYLINVQDARKDIASTYLIDQKDLEFNNCSYNKDKILVFQFTLKKSSKLDINYYEDTHIVDNLYSIDIEILDEDYTADDLIDTFKIDHPDKIFYPKSLKQISYDRYFHIIYKLIN